MIHSVPLRFRLFRMRFLGLFPSYNLGACLGVLLYTGAAVADVYDGGCAGSSSVKLRIGNGGAGQSGLVKGELLVYLKQKETSRDANSL